MTNRRLERMPNDTVYFGSYRVDPNRGQLWRGDEVVHLRPKTWEVLCLLVAHAGQVLTKEQIIAVVWDGAAVSDTMPSISVNELRRVFEDDARKPRYIETVHGRGFSFIAKLQTAPQAATPRDDFSPPSPLDQPFVGRAGELAKLAALFSPSDPPCRIALISGEAGIGKTTLVERFIGRLASLPLPSAGGQGNGRPPAFLLGRGQCLAHFGDGYPYLPVLGALSSMGQGREGVIAVMRAVAPSWLVRLPALISPAEIEELRARTEMLAPSRIVEELFTLLRALGPVVWVVEDLHWADQPTVELIALAAESLALDNFWVIGTLRLAEAVAKGHGIARVRRELRRRGRCRELMLEGLSESDIDRYLAARFGAHTPPAWLSQRLAQRTSGNPFFLIHTVDHLEEGGALRAREAWSATEESDLRAALDGIPETLRDLVQEEISALGEEAQCVLGAASVAGLEFDAAMAAAVLVAPVDEVDTTCTELARRMLLLARIGETVWPDGTISGRYAFRHAIYQKVLHDGQSPAFRRLAHCRIGEAMAAAFGAGAGEVAAVIAGHFESGGDLTRAVSFYRLAAQESNRRCAAHEAALHLRRALALLPAMADREAHEGVILQELGQVLPALQGFGDPNLLALYMRVRELQSAGADASGEFTAMAGLLLANLMQRKPQPAEELAREMVELAARQQDPQNRAHAELLMGAVLYHQGDLIGTVDHAERSLALAPPGTTLGPIDHRCTGLSMLGAALWQAGRPEEGVRRALSAFTAARDPGVDPFNLVITLQPLLAIHQWRGEAAEALKRAVQLAELVQAQGISQAEACAELIAAWAHFEQGELEVAARSVERGVALLLQYGSMMQSVYLLTVAVEVLAGLGRWPQAKALLDDAGKLIDEGAARWWEPELYRWRAVLLGRENRDQGRESERLLHQSLELAGEQGSISLRLRTFLSLAELRHRQGRQKDAAALLRRGLNAIVGGEGTRDVRHARRLLAAADRKSDT